MDLGSCTNVKPIPNKMTENERESINDDIEKNTTPMYRAPEYLDLYSGYPHD